MKREADIQTEQGAGNRLVASWRTRGGKYWRNLYANTNPAGSYSYTEENGGGYLGRIPEAEALSKMNEEIALMARLDHINMARVSIPDRPKMAEPSDYRNPETYPDRRTGLREAAEANRLGAGFPVKGGLNYKKKRSRVPL